MKKKQSLLVVLGSLVFGTLTGCGGAKPTPESSKEPERVIETYEEDGSEHTKPYYITNNFGENAESELIVQWQNEVGSTNQRVQITTEDDVDFTYAHNVDADYRILELLPSQKLGDYPARGVYRAEVTGLKPGTQYIYRVGANGAWSDTYYHLTAEGEKEDFSFTVASDPQSPAHSDMGNTFRAANEYDPDHRFFFNCGDLVNDIGYKPEEIVSYTEAAAEFNKYKVVGSTQGNHDTYGTTGDNVYIFGEATVYNSFTTFPANGFEENVNKSNSYYYYYNNVLFIALNTLIEDSNYQAQADWLREVLEDNKQSGRADYIICTSHIGPIGNRYGDKWKESPIRKTYTPIFNEYKVDCVFYGHDHTYARTNPIVIDGNTNLKTCDTTPDEENGVIYSIVGATGPKFYGEDDKSYQSNIWEVRTTSQDEVKPGVFVNVSVHEEEMEIHAIRADGKELDTYLVPKKSR